MALSTSSSYEQILLDSIMSQVVMTVNILCMHSYMS
jgi:hypothetical protein